jgi:hypothetical protein
MHMPRPYEARKSFNPKETLYARRAFTSSGHRYEIGDIFTWRDKAINERRVRQMFDNGLIVDEPIVLSDPESVDKTPEYKIYSRDIAADKAKGWNREVSRNEIEDLSYRELQEKLKELSLNASGIREDLIRRILDHYDSSAKE